LYSKPWNMCGFQPLFHYSAHQIQVHQILQPIKNFRPSNPCRRISLNHRSENIILIHKSFQTPRGLSHVEFPHFPPIFISIYSLYKGDSLWQFRTALHCTFVTLPLWYPHPCKPLPSPLTNRES
jgi:hypothetical protein